MNSYIDYANLDKNATLRDIENLCDEAMQKHYASVYVYPYYIALAHNLLKNSTVQVATVINGLNTKAVKVYEAIDAIENGADEIDLSINISAVKNKDYDYVKEEIEEVRDAIDGKTITLLIDSNLLTKEEIDRIVSISHYYQKIGYKVYTDLSIKEIFKGKLTVFVGQSGAGKSTLLNKLDHTLNLQTGEVSVALGRGRHTTRHVELIGLLDGLIADTPGFSKIDFNEMSKSDIRDNFIEFNKYREKCEYKDCMHHTEVNCEVKRQVEINNILLSRYNNYLKFIGVKNEE